MIQRLRNMVKTVDPLVMVGLGIGLITMGLQGFADSLAAMKDMAEDTMRIMAEANAMAPGVLPDDNVPYIPADDA